MSEGTDRTEKWNVFLHKIFIILFMMHVIAEQKGNNIFVFRLAQNGFKLSSKRLYVIAFRSVLV